jgi:hypothetical protein
MPNWEGSGVANFPPNQIVDVISLPTVTGVLSSNVVLPASTYTQIITPSLAVGTWLVMVSAEIANSGGTAGDVVLYLYCPYSLGTVLGPQANDGMLPASAQIGLAFSTIIRLMVPGVVYISAYPTVAAIAKAFDSATSGYPVTGYTAVKIG